MRDLKIAAEASPVNGLAITSGHLRLQLASGSAARVLAGQEPIGIFFKGTGTLEYTAAERTEIPVVKYNAHATSHLSLAGDGPLTLSEPITEVLLIRMGEALPELSGNGAAPLAEAFAAHQALFARGQLGTAAELSVQKASGAPFTRAEIDGADHLVYTYDTSDRREESLVLLRNSPYAQDDNRLAALLYPVSISSQPIGHDRRVTPGPPFVLTDLTYTLTADGDQATLDVSETIFRPNPALAALRFDLVDEVYAKANRPTRKVNLRSVTDERGRSLPALFENGVLAVGLDGVQGQSFKLEFAIDGDFLVREGGDNAWLLDGDWFPLPRALAARAYTLHSVLRVKKPFVPVLPGKTISRREDGDYNVLQTSIDHPTSFAEAMAGKYTFVEDTRDGLTVRVASYGLPRPQRSKQLIDLAFGFIDYYQYFLGPFPYPEYNIVQVNSYGFGVAPPAMMRITNEAFDPVIEEGAKFFSEGINERFAHEIAHQYWGHAVKSASLEDWWLTEAFAEYSAGLALKKLQNEAVYNRLVNHWRSGAKQATNVAPIPFANRISGDPGTAFAYRVNLLYDKGPYLLYSLHKQLGDTQFLTFLKSYQKSFLWKFGTTNDVAGLLGFMTKKDFKPFFEQYFWGTAMPN